MVFVPFIVAVLFFFSVVFAENLKVLFYLFLAYKMRFCAVLKYDSEKVVRSSHEKDQES